MIRTILIALVLATTAIEALAARLEADARVTWNDPDTAFGGFSGIEIVDDGAGFVTIGDQGIWATGRMIREDGSLEAVETTGLGRLRAVDGRPLRPRDADAEGLALDRQGRFYVSFEGFHRIRWFDPIDGPAHDVPSPPEFRNLRLNGGLEALAVDAEGAIYAIPERPRGVEPPSPVFRMRDGVWDQPFEIPRMGSFLVTGADFGPDGDLFILERNFSWTSGFSTRIRRFVRDGDSLDGGETLFETAFGSTNNYEGIAVWRDPEGRTRVTLIADDNFFALQSTVIAEFLLVED